MFSEGKRRVQGEGVTRSETGERGSHMDVAGSKATHRRSSPFHCTARVEEPERACDSASWTERRHPVCFWFQRIRECLTQEGLITSTVSRRHNLPYPNIAHRMPGASCGDGPETSVINSHPFSTPEKPQGAPPSCRSTNHSYQAVRVDEGWSCRSEDSAWPIDKLESGLYHNHTISARRVRDDLFPPRIHS